MGLSLKDSEAVGYLAKIRDIEIATKMFNDWMDKEEILYYTELTEDGFIKDVVNKSKICK